MKDITSMTIIGPDLTTRSKTRQNGVFQWTEYIVGSVGLSLIIGAGLALAAPQVLGQEASEASVAAILLALYVASWLYVLGIVGLVLLSLWWLVGWQPMRAERAGINCSSAAPQYLEHGVALVVRSARSRASEDETEAHSLTKVACFS